SSTSLNQQVHIVYMGDRHHDNTKLITDSHHDLLATVVGSKELASELMVYSYKHGLSGLAAKLTESQTQQLSGLGPVPSHWNGVCESGDNFNATIHCNRKIIGARWFLYGLLVEYAKPLDKEFHSPRDAHGHGTHTSSTAAGSFVANISYKGLGLGTIRGSAPNARLAIYKVCWNVLGGKCSTADMLKAFDEAIHDGVDVLSLSLVNSVPLFSDVDEHDGIATGSFHAVANRITVVCAVGNSGPSAQTVVNTVPWIITVAASTMDREFSTSITLGNNKTFLGQRLDLQASYTHSLKGLPLEGGSTTKPILLCFTTMGRRAITNASAIVKEAGGVGLIIAKNPSGALSPCNEDFPCIEVDYEIGTQILFYIRSTKYPLVKLSPPKTIVGKPLSAKVAYFSSRGPNSITPASLKALWFLSRHPNWSPVAIKSALVTTAWRKGPSGLPIFAEGSPQKLANPFDFGRGLVNPNGAVDPGLVYDMGAADYMEYLYARGYNNSAISRLIGKNTTCPVKKPSISLTLTYLL
ncbi:hypothetical protein C1H46_015447, partial [Malus baccata]